MMFELPVEITQDMLDIQRQKLLSVIKDHGNSVEKGRLSKGALSLAQASWKHQSIHMITSDLMSAAHLTHMMRSQILSFTDSCRFVSHSQHSNTESAIVLLSVSRLLRIHTPISLFGSPELVVRFCQAAKRLATENGSPFCMGRSLLHCGTVSMCCGSKEESKQIFDKALINSVEGT